MTGSLQIKKLSSGRQYYYIRLSYKDPATDKWTTKTVKTGLEAKGNKRKAEALISGYIENIPVWKGRQIQTLK